MLWGAALLADTRSAAPATSPQVRGNHAWGSGTLWRRGRGPTAAARRAAAAAARVAWAVRTARRGAGWQGCWTRAGWAVARGSRPCTLKELVVAASLVCVLPTADAAFMAKATPIYEVVPKWDSPTEGIRDFDDFPAEAQDYVNYIEESVEFLLRSFPMAPHGMRLFIGCRYK